MVKWCKCKQRIPQPGRSLCHICVAEKKSKASTPILSKGDVEDSDEGEAANIIIALGCMGTMFALGLTFGGMLGWLLRGWWI